MRHKVTITVDEVGRNGKVLLDDLDITDLISGVAFNCGAGEATEVTLVLTPTQVEIHADTERLQMVKRRIEQDARRCEARHDIFGRCARGKGHELPHFNSIGEMFNV